MRAKPETSLVSLPLASQISLDPIPDRKLFGRFTNLLKGVGADGDVLIRPRMITIISSTHFKTIGGLPVSLVGLHGKDEVLVVGPKWALARLADGDVPKKGDYEGSGTKAHKVKSFAVEQLYWFTRLPELVAVARGVLGQRLGKNAIEDGLPEVFGRLAKDSDWKRVSTEAVASESSLNQFNACEMLQGLLLQSMEVTLSLWDSKDWLPTIFDIVKRRETHITALREKVQEPYQMWWLGYDDIPAEDVTPNNLGETNYRLDGEGIDVGTFPEFRTLDDCLVRGRNNSVHSRWIKLCSKEAGSPPYLDDQP
jgi:hypothetical protein